jgi:hypothetical protein
MERLTSAWGYDIYELSKEECKENGRVYPTLCAFSSDWDEAEDGERHVDNSESEFETLKEAKGWCNYYQRNVCL